MPRPAASTAGVPRRCSLGSAAHRAGLIDDPYGAFFLPPNGHVPARDPIISRGTYLRIQSIDDRLAGLLAAGPLQVLSLGAGFDTRFFKFQHSPNLRGYAEVDFEEVVSRKRHCIQAHGLQPPALLAADLEVSFAELTLPRILGVLDATVRTLVLAECCLMYLSDAVVGGILTALAAAFPDCELLVFEPVYVGDRFGKTMARNLGERGLSTETFLKYPDVAACLQRIARCGWPTVSARTMLEVGRDPLYAPTYRAALCSCC